MEETPAKKTLSTKAVIIAAAVVVAVVVAAAVIVVRVLGNRQETPSSGIGYATEAAAILTQEEMQAAMDAALANGRDGNVALLYKENAYSSDGVNFSCYIVNSQYNSHDMFLTIFADAQMTDQIFLSQLVPPGSGFESITLEHPLEQGDHTVYVALTQVARDEETGEESLHKQVVHTMTFHVTAQ